MNTVAFSIPKIRSGWFVCRFGDLEIWASDAWDHDGARQLLVLLANCVSGAWKEGYAVLDGEPGTCLVHIRAGERAELTVFDCPLSHHDWYPGDLNGAGEIPRRVTIRKTLLHKENVDLFTLALAVSDAFDSCLREEYERNWMPFPDMELAELKHTLGDFC